VVIRPAVPTDVPTIAALSRSLAQLGHLAVALGTSPMLGPESAASAQSSRSSLVEKWTRVPSHSVSTTDRWDADLKVTRSWEPVRTVVP
jgi:hypothetical protein